MRIALTLVLIFVCQSAFALRWEQKTVTWSAPAKLHKDAAKAFRDWGKIIKIDFVESTVADRAEIQLSYGDLNPDHLGITHRIFEGEKLTNATVQINQKYDGLWNAERMDLLTVIRHEIGHAIGLEHDEAEESIMYEFAGPRKKISNRDIETAWKLYKINFKPRR